MKLYAKIQTRFSDCMWLCMLDKYNDEFYWKLIYSFSKFNESKIKTNKHFPCVELEHRIYVIEDELNHDKYFTFFESDLLKEWKYQDAHS